VQIFGTTERKCRRGDPFKKGDSNVAFVLEVGKYFLFFFIMKKTYFGRSNGHNVHFRHLLCTASIK
jgi:hypothetical protein